jgi:hypothetical protein
VEEAVKEWEAAFFSLYTQLRSGTCPFFYLRGEALNALFW